MLLSTPVNQLDPEKPGITVRNINVILKNMSNIELIDNSNITEKYLGRKKLHLNPNGSTILVRNILRVMNNI